jgi:hypothetical protein
MKPIPFIGSSYQARSPNFANSRCINLYLEAGKGKSPGLLIGTPGLTAPWVTLTNGGMRGMFVVDENNCIMVCGGLVWKVTSSGATSTIGTVPDDDRPVQITTNGTDIIVYTSGSLYAMTLAGTSSTLLGAGYVGIDVVGKIFVTCLQNSSFYSYTDAISTIADYGADFAANTQDTNSKIDVLVGVRVMRRTAYFFGTKSIEPWYESGVAGQVPPFSRIDGGVFEVGCIAPDSIAELDSLFWLGGDENGAGTVWTVTGGRPQKISTPAIEYAIAQWPSMADAEAFCYQQEGHAFYVLSSTLANQTFVFDISTGEWHERGWLHPSGEFNRIRPRCHAYFAGKHLVGDWENGNVYEYSLDCYDDNGTPLVALRSCTTLESGMENTRTMSFLLDCDTGYGLPDGQGSDPVAMLRWSKDGGVTWSNALWRTLGKIGEYSRRAVWRRVGSGRRVVYEVKISDPVKRNITGAYIA